MGVQKQNGGTHHLHQPLRLAGKTLHQGFSNVSARPVFIRHPSNAGEVGTDVIERGTYSHEDAKQTGSEQHRLLPACRSSRKSVLPLVEELRTCTELLDSTSIGFRIGVL